MHVSNFIFLFLKISFIMLFNHIFFPLLFLFLICPWKVWQEECAVCNSGNADWLQFHTGLLYQLGDVFSVVCAGWHGTDI